jgi:glycerate dehydrogenase
MDQLTPIGLYKMISSISRTCLVDETICLTTLQTQRLQSRYKVLHTLKTTPTCSEVVGMLLHSEVDQKFLDQFENLKWIGIRAKNTSYVPDSAKIKYNVFGIPSLADIAVAEHVFALILALTKQLLASHKCVVTNQWRGDLFPNTELYNKKIGIIGYGTIGKRVAKIAEAFQMEVLIANKPSEQTHLPLEYVLKNSDIITLHLPSRPENVNFLNDQRLRCMRAGAILINTSRGDMVDEEALKKIIQEGLLGGVGLDVLETEPPTDLALTQFPNVLITPHFGFQTVETLERMTESLIDTVLKKELG